MLAIMDDKIHAPLALAPILTDQQRQGKKVVFTNGCFDLLHPGHVLYLREARQLGDSLVVALNTDASVRRLGKGVDRPIVKENDRAIVIAALAAVDFVTFFDEDTPLEVIQILSPDILVKGGDWSADRIVGAEFVRSRGGEVYSLPFATGYSTTDLIQRIRAAPSY